MSQSHMHKQALFPVEVRPPGRRREWNSQHHVVHSTLNPHINNSQRSYFGRPRELNAEYEGPEATKVNWLLGSQLPVRRMETQPAGRRHRQEGFPQKTLPRIRTAPNLSDRHRQFGKWNSNHQVIFGLANENYIMQRREYFDNPVPFGWRKDSEKPQFMCTY
eukprot:GEMP01063483.1.p1 GENE.GEMP01063483.1~~GEMP01063483.1.p1  ORF type:complete len:162 (+),score=24.85 GEMP01063483.1:148-633(+)